MRRAAPRAPARPILREAGTSYLERYYYSSITPLPNSLFRSDLIPPNGPNFYYLSDPVMDKILADYASAIEPAARMAAIKAFEKRWYDTEPMTILFYPEDAIAVNPKLTGFAATTFNPVFFPQPENWTSPAPATCDGSVRVLAAAEFADPDVHHRLP